MEQKFKMEPKDFNKYLHSIKLVNISLRQCKAKFTGEVKLPKSQKISIKDSFSHKKIDDFYEILHNYSVTGYKDRKKILDISATFCVIIESEEKLSDDFFEVYNNINLPINTWPFMREFVNSTTARMNIPPLTLPLLKR